MKLYEVVGTNGNGGMKFFRVHKAGCRDIETEVRATFGHSWTVEAASAEEVVKLEMLRQKADDNPFPRNEYQILYCALKGA